ncbi:MAG: thioredoxin family protein [Cyanophyceae cyanobacterium]
MSENISDQTRSTRLRNILIAIAAVALSVAVFLGLQTQGATLEAQAEQSVPLEVALSNGKPTLTEFYANWCTSCQAMAEDLADLKQQYAQEINFVMLNVDNTKWLPEVLRYQVDGIPHFVFFNAAGEAIAETIGEQPRSVLQADLAALVADLPLPYTYRGQMSELNSPVEAAAQASNPRSHGAQVK